MTELRIERLEAGLTQLVAHVPQNRDELRKWYVQARAVEDDLTAPGGLSADVPHFLWHYLADADIRLKDKDYADLQQRRMQLFLQHLRRGVMPSDQDIEV